MRNGKHVAKRTGSKMLVTALALVLVCCMAVGGTMAWLMDSTDEVVNTFTTSDINITLTETDVEEDGTLLANSYQIIPGYTIDKDPKVTVKANSEKCYLFVKVTTAPFVSVDGDVFSLFIDWNKADGWIALEEKNGSHVYYRVVDKATEDQEFSVLAGDKVTVKDTVTKDMMDMLAVGTLKMQFTAYAIQYYANNTATEADPNGTPMDVRVAWETINPDAFPPTTPPAP